MSRRGGGSGRRGSGTRSPHGGRKPDRSRGQGKGQGKNRRRPMSMPGRRGRLSTTGDPLWAEPLGEALRAANRGADLTDSLTHGVHTYPARMHPATARALVELLVGPAIARAGQGSLPQVLDPFCGSGTTLVEARFAGARAVGLDANPLAIRLAAAKTWTALRREREAMRKRGLQIAERSMAEAKAARRSGYEAPPHYQRARGDELISGWFPRHVRRELEYLYAALHQRGGDTELILSVPLSAILYKVSRRTSDTDPTRLERKIGRGQATRLFHQRVDQLFDGLDELARGSRAPIPRVALGDARRLPDLRADAVITSPPYPGTYDYAKHHDLRMAFLELDPRPLEKSEIGTRRKGAGGIAGWRADTRRWLEQAARALGSGGMLAAVVGDSVAGRSALFADRELAALAPKSLELVAQASQTRLKLGGREARAFGDRPKREHIVLFARQ